MSTVYSRKIVWIHWISFAVLILGVGAGIESEHTPINAEKLELLNYHVIFGSIITVLTLIRLWALFRDPRPEELYGRGSFRGRFMHAIHIAFYVVLLWMSFSGISSLFLEDIFPAIRHYDLALLPDFYADGLHPLSMSHHIVAKLVILLFIIHIVGAAIHMMQTGENVLKRIWFKKKKS